MSRLGLTMILFSGIFLSGVATQAVAASPFATRVLAFDPAPGQFVNDPTFDDSAETLGPPSGGGTTAPNNASLVSLGGFGGSLVLGFDHTVVDHYHNRRCLDAIAFGNAHFPGGDPERRWAEAGVIEISVDANQNGMADDVWYLIPGSHLNDLDAQWASKTWDADTDDATYPPEYAAWLPPGRGGVWTTFGYLLPALFNGPVLSNPLGTGMTAEGIWGYADLTPTLLLGDLDADNQVDDPNISPEVFYTNPNDPYVVGISSGSGGGDAFDIADAIDPNTGELAGLTSFDFIRISTAVDSIHVVLGEISTEIDAVSDVGPGLFGDSDWDDDVDEDDWSMMHACFTGPAVNGPLDCPCRMLDADLNATVDLHDLAAWQEVYGS